ncbi:MAG: response regulator transcription factor [Candidatus Obscuribacterales bacterium]|nr:response regulator transcription factor [Candidatus Obscuribacterales bacterium]
MAKILLVEDDTNLASTVEDAIRFEGHIVDHASDGQTALETLFISTYELIILDWELPLLSGIEVLTKLRAKGNSTPVLMLTGKDSISDKLTGLYGGADDYLTKPFNMHELKARIVALLRRPSRQVAVTLQAGDLTLDPSRTLVLKNGVEISLARMEFAVLEFLMRNPGQVFSSEALLERVWSAESDRTPQTVRSLIKKLRTKIDGDGPSIIHNVYGFGYKLEAPQ